jgi:hypothetical protein
MGPKGRADTKTNWPADSQSYNQLKLRPVFGNWQLKLEVSSKGTAPENLCVCRAANTVELMNALWIKRCCGCGTGTVREPRKGNVRLWKPVLEDWWGTADQEDSVRAVVSCRLWEMAIAPEWITNYELQVSNKFSYQSKAPRLYRHTSLPRSWQYFKTGWTSSWFLTLQELPWSTEENFLNSNWVYAYSVDRFN